MQTFEGNKSEHEKLEEEIEKSMDKINNEIRQLEMKRDSLHYNNSDKVYNRVLRKIISEE